MDKCENHRDWLHFVKVKEDGTASFMASSCGLTAKDYYGSLIVLGSNLTNVHDEVTCEPCKLIMYEEIIKAKSEYIRMLERNNRRNTMLVIIALILVAVFV